jgi:geranylgeranyl pyrophosphate synthase
MCLNGALILNLDDVLNEELRTTLIQKLNQHVDMLPDKIRDRIRDFILANQGKMLRPLLVVATAKLLGANEEQLETAYVSGVVVELLHNFSLIHDDIIDGAPIRRGHDSYHIKHGPDLAIHDGDILHSYALSFIRDDKSLRLMLEISNKTGVGNAIELEDRLENVFDFTKDHVIKILQLKTAMVFYGCVSLAGIACQREVITESLKDIITDGGIAFQIQDDLLDIVGESKKFGKQSFWDIQESKRNLFLYYSLQTEHKEKLIEIYKKPVGKKSEEDIKFVVDVFKQVKDNVIADRDLFLETCLNRLENKIENAEKSEDSKLVDLYNFIRELIIYLCTREK